MVLRQPNAISVKVFSNPTQLTNDNFIFDSLRVQNFEKYSCLQDKKVNY